MYILRLYAIIAARLCIVIALLWPSCVADAVVIFLSCFFVLSSLFFFLFSLNLSDRRLDVYHTFTHGVALVRF